MAVQRCEHCELGILRQGDRYTFGVPAKNLMDKLENQRTLKIAYETGKCPLCGRKMTAARVAKAGYPWTDVSSAYLHSHRYKIRTARRFFLRSIPIWLGSEYGILFLEVTEVVRLCTFPVSRRMLLAASKTSHL
jgi:hypothetical protein